MAASPTKLMNEEKSSERRQLTLESGFHKVSNSDIDKVDDQLTLCELYIAQTVDFIS